MQPKAKLSLQIRKLKPLRSNPVRFYLLHVQGDDFGYCISDESIHVGYRKPDVVTVDTVDDDQDLSDEIKFQLFLFRQIALMKASGYDLKARV